jgi:hypothetical protein
VKAQKNVALAFLLGTFITGGALGFSANRYMERGKVCVVRGENPLVEVMSRRLQLSPDQRSQMDSILDKRSHQYREAMAPLRPQLDSIKLEARDHMRGVLDERQRAQFEAMILEMSDSSKKDDEQA